MKATTKQPQSQTKSKQKALLQITPPKNYQTDTSVSPPKTPKYFNSQSIALKFQQFFNKNIKNQINIIQSLSQSQLPQKCFKHNMNYSLYCQSDHKVLCMRCMMQNNAHKLHTVKPMAQALNELTADCDKYSKQLDQCLAKLNQFTIYVNAEIQRITSAYPAAKDTLQSLFKALHQFLFDLQKQSVRQLRAYKQLLLEQQNLRAKQLRNALGFVEDKKNKYKNKGQPGQSQDQKLLLKRNIYAGLGKAATVIGEGLKIQLNQKSDKYVFQNGILDAVKQIFNEKFYKSMPWGLLKKVEKPKQQKSPQKSKSKNNKILKHQKNSKQQPFKNQNNLQSKEINKTPIKNPNSPKNITTPKKLFSKVEFKNNFSKTEFKTTNQSPPTKIKIRSRSRSISNSKSISKVKSQLMKKNSLLIIQPTQNNQSKIKLIPTRETKQTNNSKQENILNITRQKKSLNKTFIKNKQIINVNELPKQQLNKTKNQDKNKSITKSKDKNQNDLKNDVNKSPQNSKVNIINNNNAIKKQKQDGVKNKQRIIPRAQRKLNDLKQ